MPTRFLSDDLSHRLAASSGPELMEFVGMQVLLNSPAMRTAVLQARRIAPMHDPVLITGESGTGKEVLARAIHHFSGLGGQFVAINCAAFPEHLIESELFGYEKGAFSGADSTKPGLFETAEQGTLLLDEIGELDPRMQAKLLRVLDGQPYYRLGGNRKVVPQARIVAATNLDMKLALPTGRFRADLFHRLDVYSIDVPPLRRRPADIAPLARFFLESHGLGIADEAIALLMGWSWPGNVRELRNVISKAALSATSMQILGRDLPPEIRFPGKSASLNEFSLELIERRTILKALDVSSGNQQQAANRLGISRRTLLRKLKTYRELEEPAGELVA